VGFCGLGCCGHWNCGADTPYSHLLVSAFLLPPRQTKSNFDSSLIIDAVHTAPWTSMVIIEIVTLSAYQTSRCSAHILSALTAVLCVLWFTSATLFAISMAYVAPCTSVDNLGMHPLVKPRNSNSRGLRFIWPHPLPRRRRCRSSLIFCWDHS
jgi:hypothetical protein